MNNFLAMPVLTQEQQKIIADTCNVMVNRADSSEHSQNLRVVAQIALAALTAEPKAYLIHEKARASWLSFQNAKGFNPKDLEKHEIWQEPLYAAPTAPVLRVQDGWKLVPIEPTEDMLAAAKEWFGLTTTAEGVYEKMLDAAPEASNEQ